MSGDFAEDGMGKNGLYTEVLINELNKTNASIYEILNRVATSVKEKSKFNQSPSSFESISNDCFRSLNFTDALKKYSKKFAMIIGNSSYTKVSPQRNSLNDSNDIKQYFTGQKFTIFQKNNFTVNDIPSIFSEIKKELTTDSVFVFYYAGHAVEINKVAYLIPIDAEAYSEEDINKQGLKFSDLVDAVNSSKSSFNFYFVDASRDNPFSNTTR